MLGERQAEIIKDTVIASADGGMGDLDKWSIGRLSQRQSIGCLMLFRQV